MIKKEKERNKQKKQITEISLIVPQGVL